MLIASDDVTTRSAGAGEDEYWRRPVEPAETGPANPPSPPSPPVYTGPPSAPPPPPNWRPPVLMQPSPPRELPSQDHSRLDAEEERARTVTYGLGIAAGVVLLVVIGLLCSRII